MGLVDGLVRLRLLPGESVSSLLTAAPVSVSVCLSNFLSAVCGKANRKSTDMKIEKSVLALVPRTQFRRSLQISAPSDPT